MSNISGYIITEFELQQLENIFMDRHPESIKKSLIKLAAQIRNGGRHECN